MFFAIGTVLGYLGLMLLLFTNHTGFADKFSIGVFIIIGCLGLKEFFSK
jgi:predicted membrane channel-forming protein YqfA (hemolysin III family)